MVAAVAPALSCDSGPHWRPARTHRVQCQHALTAHQLGGTVQHPCVRQAAIRACLHVLQARLDLRVAVAVAAAVVRRVAAAAAAVTLGCMGQGCQPVAVTRGGWLGPPPVLMMRSRERGSPGAAQALPPASCTRGPRWAPLGRWRCPLHHTECCCGWHRLRRNLHRTASDVAAAGADCQPGASGCRGGASGSGGGLGLGPGLGTGTCGTPGISPPWPCSQRPDRGGGRRPHWWLTPPRWR